MKPILYLATLICCVFTESSFTKTSIAAEPTEPSDQTIIAFGACAHEDRPQPIWNAVVAAKPDRFIFAGDNIYADTTSMDLMRSKYSKLAAQPGYQKLLVTCPVLAVWDDHDFGVNDGGKTYPKRAESEKIFLDFFGVPKDDPRREHEGIYGSQIIGEKDRRVQVILLDTRYFRDDLDRYAKGETKPGNIVGWYKPTKDKRRTLLGETQWEWLERELKKPAEVRIIVSSIQVISWEKGMERWGNMPHERERLFKLIESTQAKGAFFISGDVHFTELSQTSEEGPYPLYDLTSSGLNQSPGKTWYTSTNSYRKKGNVYSGRNFGLIQIDWAGENTTIGLQGRTESGAIAHEKVVKLRQLR
ncbi:MAG: phosphodiesterase [Rhodopirellula sp.]|nr:phosphodiesterase [Rhodopirellula sp.]